MSQYKIVCTLQEPRCKPNTEAHIVKAGTGDNGWSTLWTVAEIYAAMDKGDVFYTVSPSTGKVAIVHKWTCSWCNLRSIRSAADAVTDNNLDSLNRCGRAS